MSAADITRLVESQPGGFALQQVFYRDRDIYRRELDRIFMRSWLYAGHVSQLKRPGDYILYELDTESVIIIRESEDTLHALVNVCRHRGSKICREQSGNRGLLVCPYHGWTYEKNGALRGAGHMQEGFDKTAYSLRKVHLKVFHGMIFINFDDDPVSFAPIERDLDECLRPYRLEKAKIAYRKSYPMRANWKLAVENYCECYHCVPAHPEYAEAHGRSFPDGDMQDLTQEVLKRSRQAGLSCRSVNFDWLESGSVGNDRSYDRYPLLHGFVTPCPAARGYPRL